jgi:AraC-like DNA-binding protein
VLDSLGADVDAALLAHGFTREDFEDPDREVPYADLVQLLQDCERLTGCDYIGLLICEQSGLAEMGLPGRVARCQATVRQGLQAMIHHHNLRRAPGVLGLLEDGALTRLVYAIVSPGTYNTHDYQMGGLAVARNMLLDLCGPDWQPVEVRCACRSPSNTRIFQRFFHVPVHFDADESTIVFESHWLERALPPVDESYRQAVAAQVRQQRKLAFDDFPGLVRDLVRKQLSRGGCSIESVAAALSMHRRTLERRLAQHGEAYGALQASVKFEIAQRLLRETRLSVQQIGEFLGFSTGANFATAFRRWSGRSPRRFRREEAYPPSAIVTSTSASPNSRNASPVSQG